ncbi:MAG: C10 family peptidase [Candidatus Cloacimonetes bacterium]|nr:C10 family peptidase [Candidatus Cloacimonadota bacterium]
MKKRMIVVILILLVVQLIQAEPRNDADMQIVRDNFIAARNLNYMVTESYALTTENTTLAVIYNLSPDGFVIIAADDDFYPVPAYSKQGSYDPEINADDLQFRFIAEDLTQRREYYLNNPTAAEQNRAYWQEYMTLIRPDRTFQQWPMDGTTSTDGWCETQWTQSGVYNDFCPLDTGGNRSVVGCVATAMAQIMYFHQYAGNPVFGAGDNYNSGWWNVIHIDSDHESNDFPNWAELNAYMEDLADHFESGEQLTSADLASLNYACGVSVEMSYSADGSGAMTEDVASALRYKFDYDSATWSDNNGGNFYTNIANNMKQMKPCEFSIYTEGWNDGHAIVCDGYNTDNYFHLNYGWGSSNIGWYYLPVGMPSNYSIIGGAVRNIEGGEVPISVTGSISGVSDLEGCHLILEGEKYSYESYADEYGNFEVEALLSGWYTVSALLNRTWFVEEEFYLDSNNNDLALELFNYEALTGTVTAPVSPEGAYIALYSQDDLIATDIADNAGNFYLPDILPGVYKITASLSPDYYGENEVVINPQNQSVAVGMQAFDEEYSLAWSGEATEIYTIVPIHISCAIKLNAADLEQAQINLISGVKFISPIEVWQGTITAQLWKEQDLLVETPVNSFSLGEEITVSFPLFEMVDEEADYFVGYAIYSDTGDLAWHDAGPRVPGKGAWFHITNWVEMSNSFDFNFCISAEILSAETITAGDKNLLSGLGQITACYPNPYIIGQNRSFAGISYSLEKSGFVDILCYNVRGQKVAHPYTGYNNEGEHVVEWKPDALSSGLYFYRLLLDDKTIDVKRTIVIK